MSENDDMLILTDIGNESEIAKISMYGNGDGLRTWLIAKLQAIDHQNFIEFARGF